MRKTLLLTGIAAFLVAATALAADTSSSSSMMSGDAACGRMRTSCVAGSQPQCIGNRWQCISARSSSSTMQSTPAGSTELPCGPLRIMCRIGAQAQCIGHVWRCLPAGLSLSSSSSSSSASSMSFVLQARLRITNLTPPSGPADTKVTIQGRGLSPDNNTVRFGGVTLSNLPSADAGHVLTFTVPDASALTCAGGGPGCAADRLRYGEDRYPVSVVSGNGAKTNTLYFIVTNRTASGSTALSSSSWSSLYSPQSSSSSKSSGSTY